MTAEHINRAMLAMLATITLAVLYMTFMVHGVYRDYQAAKPSEIDRLAAEACRLSLKLNGHC